MDASNATGAVFVGLFQWRTLIHWLRAKLGGRPLIRILLLEMNPALLLRLNEIDIEGVQLFHRAVADRSSVELRTTDFDAVILSLFELCPIDLRDNAIRDALWAAGESTPCIMMMRGTGGVWLTREHLVGSRESDRTVTIGQWAQGIARGAGRMIVHDTLSAALNLSCEDNAAGVRRSVEIGNSWLQTGGILDALLGTDMRLFASKFPSEMHALTSRLRAESLHNSTVNVLSFDMQLDVYVLVGQWDRRLHSIAESSSRFLPIPAPPVSSSSMQLLAAAADRGLAAVAATFGSYVRISRGASDAMGFELPPRSPGTCRIGLERSPLGAAWHTPMLLHMSVGGGAQRFADGSLRLSTIEALFPGSELRFVGRSSAACSSCRAAVSSALQQAPACHDIDDTIGVHTKAVAAAVDTVHKGVGVSRVALCTCHPASEGGRPGGILAGDGSETAPLDSFDPCFPHGNSGAFFNAGLARWHHQRAVWSTKPLGYSSPPPPRITDYDAISEAIEDPASRRELPGPVRLSDMVDCCQDVWDVPDFTESDEDW
jgi:hypothetical protein